MVMTVAILVVALSGVAFAARISGTSGSDTIRGTAKDDKIRRILYGMSRS